MAKSNPSSPFMCTKGPTDSRTSIFLGSKLLWHETGIVHSSTHHRRSLQRLCVTVDRSKSLNSIKLLFLSEQGLVCCWFLSALLLDYYCIEQGLLFALFFFFFFFLYWIYFQIIILVWTMYRGVIVKCPIRMATGDLSFKTMRRK